MKKVVQLLFLSSTFSLESERFKKSSSSDCCPCDDLLEEILDEVGENRKKICEKIEDIDCSGCSGCSGGGSGGCNQCLYINLCLDGDGKGGAGGDPDFVCEEEIKITWNKNSCVCDTDTEVELDAGGVFPTGLAQCVDSTDTLFDVEKNLYKNDWEAPCPNGEDDIKGLCEDCYKKGKGNRKCLCYDEDIDEFYMPSCNPTADFLT